MEYIHFRLVHRVASQTRRKVKQSSPKKKKTKKKNTSKNLSTRYYFASGRKKTLPPQNIELLLRLIRQSDFLQHLSISNIDKKSDMLVVTIHAGEIPDSHMPFSDGSPKKYMTGQDLYEDIETAVRIYEDKTDDNLTHSQYTDTRSKDKSSKSKRKRKNSVSRRTTKSLKKNRK